MLHQHCDESSSHSPVCPLASLQYLFRDIIDSRILHFLDMLELELLET
ncbi:hypothetical protein F383_03681 [Gossypium arboreum]|uniref:Uncharacterized protein n=1 Tax=Gossypium arboreum TaxID=29729 RepID=A0A0B0PAD9_GOSAR|nr:hypothetical protein F383_03681 [Gossypium arboreum]